MLFLTSDDADWPGFLGVDAAIKGLSDKKDPLKAVEERICAVENAGLASVGATGIPDSEGVVTLDAGIMSGKDRLSAGIGSLQGYQSPFLVAKELWDQQRKGATPHNYIVGEGAAKFAASVSAEKAKVSSREYPSNETVTHDTVGCICWDGRDQWFVGTSTSGFGEKHPGRLGDSCTAGAGFYAFPKGAVFCTWTGELSTRLSIAARVAIAMEDGIPPVQAIKKIFTLVNTVETGPRGPLIIFAASPDDFCVAGNGFPESTIPATYTFWRPGMDKAARKPVLCFDV